MILSINKSFSQPLIDEVKAAWELSENQPPVQLQLKHILDYFQEGNRLKFENEYFGRRKELLVCSLYAMEMRTPPALRKLEEIIYLVLQEHSWALPAHWPSPYGSWADRKYCIDLFAAETAQALAEISHELKEFLSPMLLLWISQEIEERIFQPFENKKWDWEQKENNWSAVIAGSIGMAALRQLGSGSRRQAILDRLDDSFQSFLRGYGQDGVCVEGMGYWAYGFGYYIYYAALLESTTGESKYFQSAKVNAIASFPYYAQISEGEYVPFGDYNHTALPSGLLSFLKERLQVPIPNVKTISSLNEDSCYRFAPVMFNLMHSSPCTQEKTNRLVRYFENSQWLVVRDQGQHWGFAARGGSNQESHNHNDLGHFVYGGCAELQLTDFGAGEYTKDYFDEERRYTYFVNSGFSHSIPIINGHTQMAGNYQARVLGHQLNGNLITFTLELSEAYPNNSGIISFKRKFELNLETAELQVKDEMHFKNERNEILENFVTGVRPVIVGSNSIQIEAKGKKVMLQMNEPLAIHTNHYQDHYGNDKKAYQIQGEYTCGNKFEFSCQIILINEEEVSK
ncbi:hypothetical protein SDC9_55126 [bioreactor metagenome]|uniref:Heparinase II/III-like protein n=1 Tax=bioreactor metagenome TaxID=1076179 RepID=A0A644WY25_9ZZZZ